MPLWLQTIAVAAGGAAGAAARLLVSKISATYLSPAFPSGTLVVNAAGSLLLGLLSGLALARTGVPMAVRLLVGVGFCGAFTTFSTFAVETLATRSVGLAILNIALNNILSIGLAAAGLYVGVRI